jgi:hypothetical protein
MVLFFYSQGMVYNHHVPKGKTVNAACIADVPQEFLRHLKRKGPWGVVPAKRKCS